MTSEPPSSSPYPELCRLVADLEVALERMERDGMIDTMPDSESKALVVDGYQRSLLALAAHFDRTDSEAPPEASVPSA